MEARLTEVDESEDLSMVRGRRPKPNSPPKRFERLDTLKKTIVVVTDELLAAGYGGYLKPPSIIKCDPAPIQDPPTEGFIGHAVESLGSYIQRVSIVDNFSQRPPFDHMNDTIYRRLIRDFLDGAVMPESKVAALAQSTSKRVASLDERGIKYSIIDGLQRLYCYCIAVLLVFKKDKLILEGCILSDHWDYFKDLKIFKKDTQAGVQEILSRLIRYEIFYNIDLAGLLHYMVTFNTGQRRMNFSIQLEIMKRPLLDELDKTAGIPIIYEIEGMPGQPRDRDKFLASDLILATEAFMKHNPHVTKSKETERIMDEEPDFLAEVNDVADVVDAFKSIALKVHPKVLNVYAGEPGKRHILSASSVFLISLAAACGYVRSRNNMKTLEGALQKLQDQLDKPEEDPLKLGEYQDALKTITASRGKATRRLVYDTFVRFFTGATLELEWMDTARGI